MDEYYIVAKIIANMTANRCHFVYIQQYHYLLSQIQLLHCIDQIEGTGGENILSDGFKAAEELKKEDPEAFEILTTTLLEFYDKGSDSVGKFHQRSRHPTIR